MEASHGLAQRPPTLYQSIHVSNRTQPECRYGPSRISYQADWQPGVQMDPRRPGLLGRLRQDDRLSSQVQGPPGQHHKTQGVSVCLSHTDTQPWFLARLCLYT